VASQGGWKTGENQFPGHTKLGSDSATPIASEGLRCSQQSEARYAAWKPSTATVPDLQYACLLTALNIKCTFIRVLNSHGQGNHPVACMRMGRSHHLVWAASGVGVGPIHLPRFTDVKQMFMALPMATS
jgi:hypothetical protein